MSERTLAADGVTRDFNGLRALDDVSLRLAGDQVLGLIGPNGSGKSTLVNILSGTLRPDRGRVLVDGREATGRRPQAMARLGVARTFQTVRLFGSMSVRENVQTGVLGAPARPGGTDARVDDVLDFAELRGWEHAPAAAIPYGLQRRVEIARGLAMSPAFLLLDEPAAGLNEEESNDLMALIRRIHDQGVGILVIDHDLRLILRLCQRVHVLVGGRTLVEGPPSQVRAHEGVVAAYIGTRHAAQHDPSHGGKEPPP